MATLTITELRRTGAGILEPTPTVLRWTSGEQSAPRGTIPHQLTVKTVRQEVPGSEQPVEQVLAATWQPFELSGWWDDRYAGRGFAARTYDEVARLVQRGSLVRVQLDQLAFVGIITEFKPEYRTRDRIGWALVLSPHQNETVGEARAATPAVQAIQPVSRHVAAASATVDTLTAAHADAGGIPLATDLHDTAGDDLDALGSVTAKLRSASEAGFEQDAAQRLLGVSALFRGVRGAAQAIPQRFARARSTAQVAYGDVVQTLRFEEWARTAGADARRAIWGAEKASTDLRVQARQRPRAVHRARAGESLKRISQRYYGTADGWRAIYEANNLASLTLVGTEELVIPERGR